MTPFDWALLVTPLFIFALLKAPDPSELGTKGLIVLLVSWLMLGFLTLKLWVNVFLIWFF